MGEAFSAERLESHWLMEEDRGRPYIGMMPLVSKRLQSNATSRCPVSIDHDGAGLGQVRTLIGWADSGEAQDKMK